VLAAKCSWQGAGRFDDFRLGRRGWWTSTDADARGIGTVRYPRVVAKDAPLTPDPSPAAEYRGERGEYAAKLAKRTLTNLYNERPTWLDLAHRRLDEAVFAAYGWDPSISDDEILAKLLELNLSRK
jgi:hypothetical protein